MLSVEKAKKLGFASLVFNWITATNIFMKPEEFEKYLRGYEKYLIDYKKARMMEAT
ncbi:MAG: hypothetical protein ABIK75_07070 [candidate division WOR-3 bacterium]